MSSLDAKQAQAGVGVYVPGGRGAWIALNSFGARLKLRERGWERGKKRMNDSFQDPKHEVLEKILPFLPHNMAAPSTYLLLKLVFLLLGFLQLQLQFLDLPDVSSRLVKQKMSP